MQFAIVDFRLPIELFFQIEIRQSTIENGSK